MACDPAASSRIAAFAAVAGAIYLNQTTQQPFPCALPSTRKDVPIMELHGKKDHQIEYEGGPNVNRDGATTVNVTDWVHLWVERDGLNVDQDEPGVLCEGANEVKTWKWGETVEHYLYADMGHVWPSEFGNNDTQKRTCKEADATRVLLDWFGKWSL